MTRRLVALLAIGIIGGPLIGFVRVFLATQGRYLLDNRHPVQWLCRSAFVGLAFTFSFALLCGLPARFVSRKLRGAPFWMVASAVLLTAFCGGSLALFVATELSELAFDNMSWGPLPFGTLVILDGALAALIALLISTYQRLKAERDATDARLKSAVLTAQIRPHFLFNTLNAISAQIPQNPSAAQDNLARLAEMFRYTFDRAGAESVPLADEIAFAREYLLLEQTRFGDRLQFELPEPVDVLVPTLTLQPLVENAVRHGICKRDDGGRIDVSLARRDGCWFLTVRNPVGQEPAPPAELFRPGHALWLLRERHPDLVVRTHVPGWFEVELKLT